MNWQNLIAENPFYEFTLIIALAAALGAVGQLLKQPLIVTFILLGIIVGPAVLDVGTPKKTSICSLKSALPFCCSSSG